MNTKGQNPRLKRIRTDLIEALHGFGGGTAKSLTEDFLGQIPSDIFRQTGLRPKASTDSFPSQESMYPQEKEEWQRRLRQAEIIRRQEKLVFTAKEQETKNQVMVLLEELKKLAGAAQHLDQQVKIAAVQAPVEPGVYHVNFFQKLISFLKSLTQKVEDAAIWASSFNARSKKRSYYWGQVQKSGTKFMLSQERYMATQAG